MGKHQVRKANSSIINYGCSVIYCMGCGKESIRIRLKLDQFSSYLLMGYLIK